MPNSAEQSFSPDPHLAGVGFTGLGLTKGALSCGDHAQLPCGGRRCVAMLGQLRKAVLHLIAKTDFEKSIEVALGSLPSDSATGMAGCNELCRHALHDACSTVSLLHTRSMLAHHLFGLRHSCWQVLSAQRRPDDLIDLGCRCSALLLAPPRCCLQQSTDPIARCAWQAVSRPVRRVHHMLRLGRASRSSPSER